MSPNYWPELRPQMAAKIEACMRRGDKIEAIRLYRDATAVGLEEAEVAIARANQSFPDQMAAIKRAQRFDSLTQAIMIMIIVGAIILLLFVFLVR